MSTPSLTHFVIQEFYNRYEEANDTHRQIAKTGILFIGFSLSMFIGAVVVMSTFYGVSELMSGNLDEASTYASLASGLASIILVLLTGWYSLETRRLVRAQEKARKQEIAEQWYGDTLAIHRQLKNRWSYITNNAAVNNYGHGKVYVADEEYLREFHSLIDELIKQNTRRPSTVDDEISKSIRKISSEWRLSSTGGNYFVKKDNVLDDELPKIQRIISNDSEFY